MLSAIFIRYCFSLRGVGQLTSGEIKSNLGLDYCV